jgi:hypothetical protein
MPSTIIKTKVTAFFTAVAFFICVTFSASAQNQVLINRLCKSWVLTKVNHTGTKTIEQAPPNFKLVIHADHTLEQGMFPDGVIKSTWSINEQSMMLQITDQKTNLQYNLKVLRITGDELELQDNNNNEPVIIYYRTESE